MTLDNPRQQPDHAPKTTAISMTLLLLAITPPSTTSISAKKYYPYQKYGTYPPYCSTPHQMYHRAIPPLAWDISVLDSELLHVTSIIRHGARTPWSNEMQCWDGYWEDPETGVWDCDLTSITSIPTRHYMNDLMESEEEKMDGDVSKKPWIENAGNGPFVLFEKKYDALQEADVGLKNMLNGTCQEGQLLLQGYEQELKNGKILRNAYLYDSAINNAEQGHDDTLATTDTRMRLFDADKYRFGEVGDGFDLYEEPNIYFRSDDLQRTVLSGQILFRGLFGEYLDDEWYESYYNEMGEDDSPIPVMTVHTADKERDIMTPQEGLCPKLKDLREEAWASEVFQSFNSSEEGRFLRAMMVKELGGDFMDDMIDCLMTTMCTDRTLPNVLNDYVGEKIVDDEFVPDNGGNRNLDMAAPDIFQRLLDFKTKLDSHHLRHNNAAYSKLGMGPLWTEIMSNILPIVKHGKGHKGDRMLEEMEQRIEEHLQSRRRTSHFQETSTPPKLALFSGHDSTIQPLLASLGEDIWDGTEWAPYASMLVIEIHHILQRKEPGRDDVFKSDYVFRLLYNGEAITSKMDGCPKDGDLCDITVLLHTVYPFATIHRDCESNITSSQKEIEGDSASSSSSSTKSSTENHHDHDDNDHVHHHFMFFLLLVVGGMAFGSIVTYVLITGKLPCLDGEDLTRKMKPLPYDNDWKFDEVETATERDDGSNGEDDNVHRFS